MLFGLIGLAAGQASAEPAPVPVITPAQPTTTAATAAQTTAQPPQVTATPAPDAQAAAVPAYNAPAPSNPYEITGIAVDVTADTAVHARDKALSEAQRSGLEQLVGQMNADKGVVARLSDDDIATLVQNFAVEDQHTSAVRYIGHYSVQYRQNAVRSWLNKKAVAYTEPGAQLQNNALPDVQPPASPTASGAPAGDVLTVVTTPAAEASNHLYAFVKIASLQQWAQIQSRLNGINAIKQVNVISLTKTSCHVDIAYSGELEALRTVFGQNRLQLTQPSIGTEWVLQFI